MDTAELAGVAVPPRFDLVFTNKEGKEETPLCIHRAPLSTHERMVGFLLEHYAGAFPIWLTPEQVRVIPITSDHNDYANQLAGQINGEVKLERSRGTAYTITFPRQ